MRSGPSTTPATAETVRSACSSTTILVDGASGHDSKSIRGTTLAVGGLLAQDQDKEAGAARQDDHDMKSTSLLREFVHSMKPETLDALISGTKVYINRRPQDGSIYATVHDFSRFGVKAIKIVRVPLSCLDPERHPDVLKAIEKAQ